MTSALRVGQRQTRILPPPETRSFMADSVERPAADELQALFRSP
ncbi:hypothetical protein [Streptomyces sp. BE133]|nr:hypothetical protein [Streptomyces sp. BE133]MEE1810160.1 hypothetical protein [Streptomyces sp. BE133]